MAKAVIILTSTFPDEQKSRSEKLRYRCNKLLENGLNPIIIKPSFKFKRREVDIENGSVECFGVYEKPRSEDARKNQVKQPQSNEQLWKRLLRPVKESARKAANNLGIDMFSVPSSTLLSLKLIQQRDVVALNTQSQPFQNNVAGLLIKKFTGVQWIMEYRDPWVNNPVQFPQGPDKINKFFEKRCIENCSELIYFDGIQIPDNYFKENFPEQNSKISKIGFVGFDDKKIGKIDAKKFNKFTIVYGGKFYREDHNPENFLKAVKQFLENNPSQRNEFQAYFIGCDKKYEALVPESIESNVEFLDWLAPEEYLSYVKGADFGLYVTLDSLSISGKMSDYIGCETPVLCLSKEGWRSWELLESYEIGVLADMNSVEDIVESLETAYDLDKQVGKAVRKKFSRERGFRKVLEKMRGKGEEEECRTYRQSREGIL